MSTSILITGGNGFVAGSMICQGAPDHHLHVMSRGAAPSALPHGVAWHQVDTASARAVQACVASVKPSAVIHAAALADIDFCEANKEVAHAVNVGFTAMLCRAAVAARAKLVYLSTDNVFDGVRGRYVEADTASPVNYYGRTKVEAEGLAAHLETPVVVARVSIVMGLPLLVAGNSFLSRMIPVLARGESLGVPPLEVRSPIDVITLGRALLELARNDFTGCIHLSGDDIVNRYDMVQRVAVALGYDGNLVEAKDPATIPGRAERPRDVSLLNDLGHEVLETPLCGLEAGVGRVLDARDRYMRP